MLSSTGGGGGKSLAGGAVSSASSVNCHHHNGNNNGMPTPTTTAATKQERPLKKRPTPLALSPCPSFEKHHKENCAIDKKETRLLKNRQAAQLFRKRQKAYIQDLEDKAQEMKQSNMELKARVDILTAENVLMKDQLMYLRSFINQAVELSAKALEQGHPRGALYFPPLSTFSISCDSLTTSPPISSSSSSSSPSLSVATAASAGIPDPQQLATNEATLPQLHSSLQPPFSLPSLPHHCIAESSLHQPQPPQTISKRTWSNLKKEEKEVEHSQKENKVKQKHVKEEQDVAEQHGKRRKKTQAEKTKQRRTKGPTTTTGPYLSNSAHSSLDHLSSLCSHALSPLSSPPSSDEQPTKQRPAPPPHAVSTTSDYLRHPPSIPSLSSASAQKKAASSILPASLAAWSPNLGPSSCSSSTTTSSSSSSSSPVQSSVHPCPATQRDFALD